MKAMLAAVGLAASFLAVAPAAFAQETGITVRSVRVLATDVDALARFYSEAFGMSETRRPAKCAPLRTHQPREFLCSGQRCHVHLP